MKRATLFAAATLSLILGATAVRAQSEFTLERSDGEGFQMLYHAGPLSLLADTLDGRIFVRPTIPGAITLGKPGTPALPVRSVLVGVPFTGEVRLEVEAASAARQIQGVPAPEPTPFKIQSSPGGTTHDFRVVATPGAYVQTSFNPGVLARIVEIKTFRNQRVARVDFYPVQSAPGAALMRSYSDIRVRVAWTGAATVRAAESADPFEPLYRKHVMNYEVARAFRRPAAPRMANPVQGNDFFAASTGPWLRMRFSKQGMYEVSQADLVGAGLSAADISALDVSTVRIFASPTGGVALDEKQDCDTCFMRELDCDVQDATGAPVTASRGFLVGDKILFYGTATEGFPETYYADTTTSDTTEYLRNPYTDENVFWLTWGSGSSFPAAPRRIARVASLDAGAVAGSYGTGEARMHFEQNVAYYPDVYDSAEPFYRWEKWWWDTIRPGDGPKTYPSRTFTLPAADTTQSAHVMMRVWGGEDGFFHQAQLFFSRGDANLVPVDSRQWAARVRQDMEGNFPVSVNQNQFVVANPNSDPTDAVEVAYFDVLYNRKLTPDGGPLFFRGPAPAGTQGFHLSGFTGQREVYAVRDFGSIRRITGGTADFFGEDVDGQRAYLVLEPSQHLHPTRIERAQYVGRTLGGGGRYLHDTDQGADDIILSYDGFLSVAQELRDWRSQHLYHNANPRVVLTGAQQVYDEFSGGRFDPTAIRNFARYAFRHWQSPALSYLTLIGDCSEDFKDFAKASPNGDGITNFVPIYENGQDYEIPPNEHYSTDDWYTWDEGQQVVNFSVGRIPADNLEQARLMVVDKTIAYEKNPEFGVWRDRIVLGADDQFECADPDPIGFIHLQQAQDMVTRHLPGTLDKWKVYLIEYSSALGGNTCNKPGAEHDYVEGMNQGALVVGFIGHGNPDQVAHEKIFSNADLGSIHNHRRLWWFLMASCEVGQVDDYTRNGLAESVMKLADGGAVCALAATQKAIATESVPMNDTLLEALFDTTDGSMGHPIGYAVMEAKLRYPIYYGTNNDKYVLQGDPALTIAAPANQIRFDSPPLDVPQGQLVEIPLTVYRNWASSQVASDFEGIDSIEVHEPETVKTFDPSRAATISNDFTYTIPAGTIFRGVGTIHGGRDTLRFYVPVGSRKGAGTRYRVYAQGQLLGGTLTDAAGAGDFTTVTGTATEQDNGPTLTLSLSSDPNAVKPGTVLHVTARCPHGIYLGIKPLNSLFVLVDGRARTLLNSGFSYKPDSFTVGSVDFPLPALDPGPHTVTVSAASNLASDLDGGIHRTTGTLAFTVLSGVAADIRNLFNYPNPVRSGETDIYFQVRDPGSATITIYTVSGRRLKTLRSLIPGGTARVHWDMRDEDGDLVPNGTFVYQVAVKTADGRNSQATGKLVVLR